MRTATILGAATVAALAAGTLAVTATSRSSGRPTLCERAVILSGGRIAADGPCDAILADAALLARHDLELPAGFDPHLVRRRPRAGSVR